MNYDVILNANDSATLETQYAFTQGDYGQIQFSIRVKADGQYVTNAQRAFIVFSLSNGMIVTGADMPKSVATYTYVFQGNELQSPGKVVADVKLVYANGQISSNKFTFMCRFDPLADKSVPAAPYITLLQQIVDEGQEKINYLQALIDSIQGGIGSTTITRNDLQNTRNPVSAGTKAIDAQMAQYLLLKSDLVNNALATTAGVAPLDAAMGKTLQDQITNANSNLTVTQIDIAQYKNAAVVSTTSNCFARSDKYKVIIDIGLALISQSLSADNITIFTLPANIRPNLPVYFTLTATDSSISVNCSIKSDGSIVVSKTPSTAKYLSGQAIFFIGK
ncbi:BppU family phage baseplate upper protein [Lacrimispora sp.]|uniref:BppU family phage baseplate upper protein n=1 Tax=Lacrimispora sp. TaxID=2719234 RepID=UPI00285B9773|nr:BppU family phage baseplate upper protein [Lacrimispora sp.]MDR7814543.1 BppU family phage baseplate upper protein [Lacrimispora sp.]